MVKIVISIILISYFSLFESSPTPPPNYASQDWTGACETGKQQSPIDFARDVPYKECDEVLKVESFNPTVSGTTPLTVDDTGIYFNLPGSDAALKVRINNYEYIYNSNWCEFHVPSEHKIHGKQYDAEFECWFGENPTLTSADPATLINTARANAFTFSVLLERDNNETDFNELSQFQVNENVASFNLQRLFNLNHGFYHYYGSDNLPIAFLSGPCAEETLWAVMRKTLRINNEQYYFLKTALAAGYNDVTGTHYNFPIGNARNTQPLNDRVVYTCRKEEVTLDENSHPSLSFLDDSGFTTTTSDSHSHHHKHKHWSDSSSD